MTQFSKRQERIAERKTARIYQSFLGGDGGAFLWKGSKDPKLVQRLGAWILGLFTVSLGVGFWLLFQEDDPIVLKVIPIALILIGAKVFRNGFSRVA